MHPLEFEQLRIHDTAPPADIAAVVRRKTDDDFEAVARGWLVSLRNDPTYANVPNETYHWWQHQLVESCWVDPTMGWLIACRPDDPDFVLGWLCGQLQESVSGTRPAIHYVYTRRGFRRTGLASRLVKTYVRELSQPVVSTALTAPGAQLAQALGMPVLFNPYLLWGRAAVPKPEMKYRSMRRRADPLVQSRRHTVVGGFKPGAAADGREEEDV